MLSIKKVSKAGSIFAKNFKKHRQQNGWSQQYVADYLKVSRQTISKWELEESEPDFDRWIPISQMFGLSLDNLLDHDIKKIIEEKKEKEKRQMNKEKIKRLFVIFSLISFIIYWIYKFIELFRITIL